MWPTIRSLWLPLSRKTAPRPAPRHRRASCRLRVQALEDRTLLSGAVPTGYGQLPLSFEVNRGQTASQVDYLARGSGYTLFLSPTQATLGLTHGTDTHGQASTPDVLRMGLVGANPAAPVVGLDRLPGVSNYFIGNDPSQWQTDVPNYGKVEYQNVYPGVNLMYYGHQGQLEYDFVLAAGGNPDAIHLSIQGAQTIRLDAQGDLVLHTAGGDVVQHAPVLYQNIGGQRQSVAGKFVLEGKGEVGFQVGAYDHRAPLVIDPVLVYSTYLGGSGEGHTGYDIAVDSAGDAYVTGYTYSVNFPTTPGAVQTASGGGVDTYVSKLNASGTALVYSTYLGGSNNDGAKGIAVDSTGDAYVTGITYSADFPTTPGAFQTALTGGDGDAFVTKLNGSGSALVYSTYLGGSIIDWQSSQTAGISIAVDTAGSAYVTGDTYATNFPTTPGAFETTDASIGTGTTFVTKFNASGSALLYSTFLGGYDSWNDSGDHITVDSGGNAYVAGQTFADDFPTTPAAFQPTNTSGLTNGVGFLTKLNNTGSALVYSTYLGGTTGNGDAAYGVAVDSTGSAYVTGQAGDSDFPTTDGSSGGGIFMTKLNPGGSALVYSTRLGNSGSGGYGDLGLGIALDSSDDAYVTGTTYATNFPMINALQGYGGNGDAFVSELNASGSALLFSTYLGGSQQDYGAGIALDSSGNIYVTGTTGSTNFPTTPGAFQTTYPWAGGGGSNIEAFVSKISLTPLPPSPSFTVAGFPSPTMAGVAHTFTVTALNADGTVNTSYAGTVHLTSSDPQAVLPADYTFTATDQGTHTFTATLKTAGTKSIMVSDVATGSIVGTEAGIVVQPAAAVKFVLAAPPSVTHGAAFSVILTVYDTYGNVATGYTGTVHFKSSDSTATLPANYTFSAADQGVHTFTGLVLRKKGKQTLIVTDIANSLLTFTDTISVL